MAISSMTGFGSATVEVRARSLKFEIRSVNHRHLDVSFRLPSNYAQYEIPLLKVVKETISRGHLDISFSEIGARSSSQQLLFHKDLFQKYLSNYRQAFKLLKTVDKQSEVQAALHILQRREVLEIVSEQADDQIEYDAIAKLLKHALQDLSRMRAREGKHLEKELLGIVKVVERLVKGINDSAFATLSAYRKRLMARIEKLNLALPVDADRLSTEITLLAERTDITEEVARLRAHIAQFRDILRLGEGGKKLDFLLQEMGREINTVGSKSQNSDISANVIEVKAQLEKLREQVQNVE